MLEINKTGDWNHLLATKLDVAYQIKTNKLSNQILSLPGMSGKKYRTLVNNLIHELDDARYLEIGVHTGSTVCAAGYNNKCFITCVDNWSQFGGPKDQFLENIKMIISDDCSVDFYEDDFRKLDFTSIGKHNVYFYDGPHDYQDQYDGIVVAQPSLEDEYILIVDDWNLERVRLGTNDAIKDLGLKVIASIEIVTNLNQEYPPAGTDCHHGDWHAGYFVSVVSKK
jgi:hypothetical protein